jgi:mono/diheme cytochrome c family protein
MRVLLILLFSRSSSYDPTHKSKKNCRLILYSIIESTKTTTMKKLMFILIAGSVIAACGGGNSHTKTEASPAENNNTAKANGNPSYDPNRGEGKFKDVQINAKLDVVMAKEGEKVYNVKCSSCHKLSDERLVGPGWKDVTKRNEAAWILNFITNTDAMLNVDPKAQAQLEICLVRMPNQSLTDQEAFSLYEFMRKNDGVK